MNRLSVRLALAFVAVTLLAVATVALAADWQAAGQFRQYLNRQTLLEAGSLMDDLAAYYQHNGSWTGVEAVMSGFERRGRGAGAGPGGPRLLLADADGIILYDSRTGRVGADLTSQERAAAQAVVVDGQLVAYLAQAGPGAQALSAAEADYLRQLRNALWLAALVAGLVGAAAGLVLSRSLTAPLARVATAARAIAQRDWTRRAPPGGTAEVADVAHAFNTMVDALQQAEAQRRNLMADIAHELRTPLSVLQGNLHALLDGVYPLELREIATLYDETRLLARLVDDLRELALAEAGQLRLALQPVAVRPSLERAVVFFAAAAETGDIRLETSISANVPDVMADPDRLAQVLGNLVTNALRHTPPGGRIECGATVDGFAAGSRAEMVTLVVSDTGEGIAAEDLPHVFDRFYRGDKSRARGGGGAGLGLAIAKSLVEAMGGTISIESTVGAGTTFFISLLAARG